MISTLQIKMSKQKKAEAEEEEKLFPQITEEEAKKDPRVAVISALHDAYLEAAAEHDWVLCDIIRGEIRKMIDAQTTPWFSIKIEDLTYKR